MSPNVPDFEPCRFLFFFSQQSPPSPPEKDGSPQPASQVKNQVVNPFTVDERVLIKVGPWFEQIFLPTLDSPIPQPEVH